MDAAQAYRVNAPAGGFSYEACCRKRPVHGPACATCTLLGGYTDGSSLECTARKSIKVLSLHAAIADAARGLLRLEACDLRIQSIPNH